MATNSDKRRPIGSGGSRSSQQKKVEHPGGRCFYNMRVVIRVSWTDANPAEEDTYSMTEAKSGMAPTIVEDKNGEGLSHKSFAM
ncbi:DUF4437 domain-containing protein [Sesbania bispinosa]|nr:DUF4437 domain-containing protein [Sesbania bispinosa]